jgi:acylglycerol lipase
MRYFRSIAIFGLFLFTSPDGARADGGESVMEILPAPEVIVMADGYRLPLVRWLPDEAPCRVVLAVHGFNDFHMAFEALAPALSSDCVAVYAHDQRGFGATATRGLWAGTQPLVDDVIALAVLLRERYPDVPLYLIGESMGAAVVILALARDEPPPVEGAVLLAPAVWARTTQPWYMRTALWLAVRIAPGMKLTAEALDVRASDLPEVIRYWREHPMVIRRTRVDAIQGVTDLMDAALAVAGAWRGPVLILYGSSDEIVPPEPICVMLTNLPDPAASGWRFVFYPQGYHLLTRDSRASETIRDIAAWLESPQASLPSGLDLDRAQAEAMLCE